MKNKIFFVIVFFFHSISLFAQNQCKIDSLNGQRVYYYNEVDSQPLYGENLTDFSVKIIMRCASKAAQGIEIYKLPSSLYISFVIDTEGKILHSCLLKPVQYETPFVSRFFEELQKSPKWKPALVNGKPVSYQMNFPISCLKWAN